MPTFRSVIVASMVFAACAPAAAQPVLQGTAGSAAFCLLKVPSDDPTKQRWINLGIVQYVEAAQNELRIAYGGGNFGSGYELRLIYGSPEEALAQIDRMRQAAAACAAR